QRAVARARRHPADRGADAVARPGLPATERPPAHDAAPPDARPGDAVGGVRAEQLVASRRRAADDRHVPGAAVPQRRAPRGDGGFQECSGLEVEMEVQEHREGGRNDGVIRQVGRAKYSTIVLKRGMFYSSDTVNRDLWKWLQGVVAGERPVARYDGVIEVMG